MSFASETKAELCRIPLSRRCCAQAEAYGVLLYCNHYSRREIRIITESGAPHAGCPFSFAKRLSWTLTGSRSRVGEESRPSPLRSRTSSPSCRRPSAMIRLRASPTISILPSWRRITAAPPFLGGLSWRADR